MPTYDPDAPMVPMGAKAMATPVAAPTDPAIIESLVVNGDCSRLTPVQRVAYYKMRCEAAGVDPRTQPFEFIVLNGKLRLYALKGCTDQLSANHGIVCEILSQSTDGGARVVTVRARSRDGRQTEEIGAVPVAGLSGENLCNAMMKAVTKAKRRAILSLCGLGMLDETEVASVAGALPAGQPKTLEELAARIPERQASEPSSGRLEGPSRSATKDGAVAPGMTPPFSPEPASRGGKPETRNEGNATKYGDDHDPDVELPPIDPPFDLDRKIQFGKYKGQTWRHLAMGSPNGRRRSWMRWAVGPDGIDPTTKDGRPSTGFEAIQKLLFWLEGSLPEELPQESPPEHVEAPREDDDLPW